MGGNIAVFHIVEKLAQGNGFQFLFLLLPCRTLLKFLELFPGFGKKSRISGYLGTQRRDPFIHFRAFLLINIRGNTGG